MKLTGVEVSFDTLSTLEPDTVLVVISDQNGVKKLVKIDNSSLPDGEVVLRVEANTTTEGPQPQSGCYVLIGGKWIWVDPCPQ
ncbi:MAG: hypothetical protein P9E24_06085 [Candidatus Competibacter sp.]|nr:hypothetical protein [Candidatus Competibacter sp.]MDG4584522.1 hypothetical protein [Candidatus Competibacter sp.]